MSSLRRAIEDGNSSIAVPFKYKYLIFLEKSGNLLIDEQPEKSAIRRDFNKYIFSGRLNRCLQFSKFNATSPLCSPIDWGSSSTAVSFKFNASFVSRKLVSGKSFSKLSCVCLSLGKLVNGKHFPVNGKYFLVNEKHFLVNEKYFPVNFSQ